MNKGQTVKGGLDVNIPNALSILRILLTPLFAALYLRGQTGAAVAVLLLETLMAAAGLYMLRVLGQVYGAQWYGKVCTALIYAVMIALLLFPDMPEPLAAGGVFTCVFMVLMCLVMYLADYARVLRGGKR